MPAQEFFPAQEVFSTFLPAALAAAVNSFLDLAARSFALGEAESTLAPLVVSVPPQCPDMVDQEAEFSIVFGAPCHNIKEEEAMGCVAGYTMINDVSARNWVENFQSTGDPDLNRMGKQLPGFTPMGPVITTKDEIPDPHDVSIK